jgi:hypothetical protein
MVQMKIGRNSTERPVSRGPHIALEHHKKLCVLPMATCESRCQVQKAQGSKLKRTLGRRTRMQMHHAPIFDANTGTGYRVPDTKMCHFRQKKIREHG